MHGIVGTQPLLIPRRRFRLYVPRGWVRGTPAPLVTLIHGCQQTAEEFAQGRASRRWPTASARWC